MIEEVNKKPASDRSVGELVTDLTGEVKRLVRDEMRLAVFELQRKGKKMGLGAGLFGAAGLFAFLGAGTLVAAAVLALALVLPGWLAAVIVAVALFVVAGIAALVGKKEVTQGVPPVPEEAISGVREDVDTVKQGVRT
ncbi:phage holin family protein [Amycolatopsis sp. DG1A-15b]|uniref:phage holin family protein n=1 Tax=Amycolatopsis sp. DG1A-15b TaxID=3052846 RepID=UPI00255B75ED|nr:phage holin family protein [Amycolatopsis sp. DG1A-15b]WIX91916.1 phage holin family protein [Amycolatopsis sp. DG1A-15b]